MVKDINFAVIFSGTEQCYRYRLFAAKAAPTILASIVGAAILDKPKLIAYLTSLRARQAANE